RPRRDRGRGPGRLPRRSARRRHPGRAPRDPPDHDLGDGGHGSRHDRADDLRRPALRPVRADRRRAASARASPAARAGGGGRMSPTTSATSRWQRLLRQLPFFVWLVALWLLLWGQFTVLAFLTGVIVAVVVTRAFRLPPVELSGRVNLWWGLVYNTEFLWAVARSSLI